MIVNTDFFISPAYWVPPISTVLVTMLRAMTASPLVPSVAGSNWSFPKSITCQSGSNVSSSTAVGRIKSAIKPFVIGRKNWLFADSPRGAKASATIYSLVETAKENGLNPMAYLTYLFEVLPNINVKDEKALDVLMPWSETIQEKFKIPSRSSR